MHLTINQGRRMKQALTFVIIGLLGGLIYVYAEGTIHIRHSLINGLLIGFFISVVLAVFELIIFRRQNRNVRFIKLFLMRMAVYLTSAILIPWLVIGISHMRRFDLDFAGLLENDEFGTFESTALPLAATYAFLIMAAVNFTRQMSRKLGQGMLIAYITGRYHQPELQERIIMFVDVIGSKAIIEKIGPLGFHHFLNNLIFDITEPIIVHSGTILHYVEDEVVISWSMKKGLTHSNCIRTFFSIKRKLEGLHEEYYDRHGFLPAVRAAVHCGTVIRAEVGVVKKEISTVGDVLNTTSRILDECHRTKTELLISGELLEKLELPALYRPQHYSEAKLRGKASEIDLFTIERRAHATI